MLATLLLLLQLFVNIKEMLSHCAQNFYLPRLTPEQLVVQEGAAISNSATLQKPVVKLAAVGVGHVIGAGGAPVVRQPGSHNDIAAGTATNCMNQSVALVFCVAAGTMFV